MHEAIATIRRKPRTVGSLLKFTKTGENMLRKAKTQRMKNAYLCGVVDGEGSFNIIVKPHDTTRFGWVIDATFTLTLQKDAEHVLVALQQALRCGRIIDNSEQPNCKLFIEQSRRNIAEKIIPFFERYPLEIKTRNFQRFKEVVERLERKEHAKPESFLRLVAFALQHTEAKGRQKYTIEDVLRTMKHKPANAEQIVQEELSRELTK